MFVSSVVFIIYRNTKFPDTHSLSLFASAINDHDPIFAVVVLVFWIKWLCCSYIDDDDHKSSGGGGGVNIIIMYDQKERKREKKFSPGTNHHRPLLLPPDYILQDLQQ